MLNGGLNLSVLDGWWAEAYDGLNGFAIGMGETHASTDVHDVRDGEALLTASSATKSSRCTTTAIATACRASGSRA